ncbi:MAG: DUF2085 domain-containing protein [Methanomassiliicoccales archaeon]|jgi:uncharacterized membrane protein
MSGRRTPFQKWKMTMLAIFVAWLAVLLIAPLSLPSGSVKDLSGAVGRLDNPGQEARMNLFAQVVYTVGDIECHQIAERSFYLNGNELPVCSRDIGISIGLLTGMLIGLLYVRRIKPILLVLGLVPMVLDGGLQALSSYQSNNSLRIVTGIVAGVAAALLLCEFAARYLETGPDNVLKEKEPDIASKEHV